MENNESSTEKNLEENQEPVAEKQVETPVVPTTENVADATEDMAASAADSEEESIEDAKEGVIKLKDHFTGKIIKIGLAGALVDIGASSPAGLHITQILRPEGKENSNNIHDLIEVGQNVDVWVKKVKDGRVELTMIKPLDLEWREIKKDMVVKGTVTRLEKFGAFVEIGAERPGLIHISELSHSYVRQPSDVLKEGEEVEAQILEVNRRKKQIKLSIKALQPEPEETEETTTTRTPRPASARAQQLKEGKAAEPREKTSRPTKKAAKKRSELNEGDFNIGIDENAPAEEEPTAMVLALRQAMEKANVRKQQSEDKKKKGASAEQEDILSRTLNSKIG